MKRVMGSTTCTSSFDKFVNLIVCYFQELRDIRESSNSPREFRSLNVDENNILNWQMLMCPVNHY